MKGFLNLRFPLLANCGTHANRGFIGSFHQITLRHIYRDFNGEADNLSKSAIGIMSGLIFHDEIKDKKMIDIASVRIY